MAVLIASITVLDDSSDNAAYIPPVCSHLTPRVPNIYSKSKSSAVALEIAVLALSEQPTAPLIPKPLSVKLIPLRHVRPIPSVFIHLINDVSTPP